MKIYLAIGGILLILCAVFVFIYMSHFETSETTIAPEAETDIDPADVPLPTDNLPPPPTPPDITAYIEELELLENTAAVGGVE